MNQPITGGCICGAVRYECAAEPIVMLKCHCRDCQHITGGPYAPAVLFPAKAFRLSKGTLRYHLTPRRNGDRHKRGFCAECGSRITGGEAETAPEMIGVLASSLDDATWFQPAMEIFTADAQPWDALDPSLPKYEGYPP